MSVEITQDGRGGSIIYRESPNELHFSWEFAMPPAMALIFGPSRAAFEAQAPWAAGRYDEIFTAVGREVVRQNAGGRGFSFDDESGVMEIR